MGCTTNSILSSKQIKQPLPIEFEVLERIDFWRWLGIVAQLKPEAFQKGLKFGLFVSLLDNNLSQALKSFSCDFRSVLLGIIIDANPEHVVHFRDCLRIELHYHFRYLDGLLLDIESNIERRLLAITLNHNLILLTNLPRDVNADLLPAFANSARNSRLKLIDLPLGEAKLTSCANTDCLGLALVHEDRPVDGHLIVGVGDVVVHFLGVDLEGSGSHPVETAEEVQLLLPLVLGEVFFVVVLPVLLVVDVIVIGLLVVIPQPAGRSLRFWEVDDELAQDLCENIIGLAPV